MYCLTLQPGIVCFREREIVSVYICKKLHYYYYYSLDILLTQRWLTPLLYWNLRIVAMVGPQVQQTHNVQRLCILNTFEHERVSQLSKIKQQLKHDTKAHLFAVTSFVMEMPSILAEITQVFCIMERFELLFTSTERRVYLSTLDEGH